MYPLKRIRIPISRFPTERNQLIIQPPFRQIQLPRQSGLRMYSPNLFPQDRFHLMVCRSSSDNEGIPSWVTVNPPTRKLSRREALSHIVSRLDSYTRILRNSSHQLLLLRPEDRPILLRPPYRIRISYRICTGKYLIEDFS